MQDIFVNYFRVAKFGKFVQSANFYVYCIERVLFLRVTYKLFNRSIY